MVHRLKLAVVFAIRMMQVFFYEKNDIDKTPFAAGTLDALTNLMRMRHI
jgi:hypothetical protein